MTTTHARALRTLGGLCATAGLLVSGCLGREEAPASSAAGGNAAPMAPAAEPMVAQPERSAKQDVQERDLKSQRLTAVTDALAGRPADEDEGAGAAKGGEKGRGGKNEPAESAPRAWFPETFLFEPLIVTDDNGGASITARVPDRLTSWRVLALAHSRGGAQGGAEASFLGTLATYVDPVTPPQLVVGDEVRLPIQLVNTTGAPVTSPLSVEAAGATVTAPPAQVTIPARGNRVEYVRLTAVKAGKIAVRVRLGDRDAVVRTIDVVSSGRPVATTRSGTLAAPRTFSLPGMPGADPATDLVQLHAYPGALAVLRSELAAAVGRGGVADDAYALLLAGRADKLLTALGEKADPQAVRELALVAGQRAIRHARTFDVASAALLAEAALSHPGNPVMQRLGARAGEYLNRAQRADGTFSGGAGWTVQRVLVATADATRALASAATTPEEARRAAVARGRAPGALERNAVHIESAYTAASVLASGAVKGKLADELRAKVKAGVRNADNGAKLLVPGEGAVRADGVAPSELEATAMAVLALGGDAEAPLADLGASLLGGYDFLRGWGDGATNLVALRAVLELFDNPLPDQIAIKLYKNGELVTEGALTKEKMRGMVTLEAAAPGLAEPQEWKIVAEPAVPGLGFSLSTRSWVPWQAQAGGGVELKLPMRVQGAVGQPIPIDVVAVAPGGLPLHVQHALPAGVSADRVSLQALVDTGVISRFTMSDGKIDLFANPLSPGAVFNAKYRVVATLAGTLHTTASLFEAGNSRFQVPPTIWNIK